MKTLLRWLLGALFFLVACQAPVPRHIFLDSPAVPPAKILAAPDPAVLRVFLHEDGFPPFDFGDPGDGSPPQGIYPELMDALCRRAGLQWFPVALPPGRIYQSFRAGDVDVEVGVNPGWRGSEEELSVYSVPFATDENTILTRKNFGGAVKVLGTVTGYVYPSLTRKFADGSLVRFDAKNERSLLDLLAGGRIDAAVMTKAVAQYLVRSGHDRVGFGPAIDRLPLSIRLHKKYTFLLPAIDRALRSLKADGTLERIYAQYR